MTDTSLARIISRSATIDELLSIDFGSLPGQKPDTEVAGRRLALWCRASASGDWGLFAKRLERDGWTMEYVLPRLATVRATPRFLSRQWITDAQWILATLLLDPSSGSTWNAKRDGLLPFEELFSSLVTEATQRRDANLSVEALARLSRAAHDGLIRGLMGEIVGLCAPALYELFARFRDARNTGGTQSQMPAVESTPDQHYRAFLIEMRTHGWSELLQAKPVLLRLTSTVTRQWIDTSQEFLSRLDADVNAVRAHLLGSSDRSTVARVDTDLSDRHKFGRSVYLVHFSDGTVVVYKPRDLNVDACWRSFVGWLNTQGPPVDLRAARVLACDGYGWAEFIPHGDCNDEAEAERFFDRAGAWLALFHIFVGTDMHEENMIAAGEHPVPIDLEMILQPRKLGADEHIPAMRAIDAATQVVAESVLVTGLLPTFIRDPDTRVRDRGGLNNRETHELQQTWSNINTDAMAPVTSRTTAREAQNVPRLAGHRVKLGDFRDRFLNGFNSYAMFLSRHRGPIIKDWLDSFSGLPMRKVIRPTRVYFMLLSRLRNHQHMADGAEWSAHSDFVSRFADWSRPTERLWALGAAERAALCELNYPAFACSTDSDLVSDHTGTSARSAEQPGLARARTRIEGFGSAEVAWQSDVVRLNRTGFVGGPIR